MLVTAPMLDEYSSDEALTPSSSSDTLSLRSAPHDLVFRRITRLPNGGRSTVSSPGGRLRRPSAHKRDIFSRSTPGPVTIFNKRRRRKDGTSDRYGPYDDSLETDQTWLSYRVLGGLRRDPFNALPVEPRGCIPNAVDHFVQILIPERIIRPFLMTPGIESLVYDYFQLAINDLAVFEATIAHCQASHVARQGIRKPTKEILHHHGKALMHLQERLADPVLATDDTTIQVILAIMGTHFFFDELDEHQSHLDGLWSLIRMRGGIETLGWNGTLRVAVETVTSFRAYATKHESPTSSPEVPQVKLNELDYPTHPFSPDLCDTITRLPIGFSDVALNRNLSFQIIDLLVDLHDQERQHHENQQSTGHDPQPSPRHHLYAADKCLQFLKSRKMPDIERMICGGLLAYSISFSPSSDPSNADSEPPPASRRTHFYDADLQAFLAELARYTYFHYDEQVLLWVVFCFAAVQEHCFPRDEDASVDDDASAMEIEEPHTKTQSKGEGDQFFHHTILRFKESGEWVRVEGVLKKFLWREERMKEWRGRWNDCVNKHRPNVEGKGTPGASSGKGASETGSARWKSESPD